MRTREQIKTYFKGKNSMTPTILEYGQRKNYVFELSEGMFMGNKIFGVTVVDPENQEDNSLSESFDSLNEAYAHIDKDV